MTTSASASANAPNASEADLNAFMIAKKCAEDFAQKHAFENNYKIKEIVKIESDVKNNMKMKFQFLHC
jgi:hypothetical protein